MPNLLPDELIIYTQGTRLHHQTSFESSIEEGRRPSTSRRTTTRNRNVCSIEIDSMATISDTLNEPALSRRLSGGSNQGTLVDYNVLLAPFRKLKTSTRSLSRTKCRVKNGARLVGRSVIKAFKSGANSWVREEVTPRYRRRL